MQGTDHLRTPVGAGIEIMERLRGRITGMGIPQLVIDAPGGGGKIPIGPNYVLAWGHGELTLRNYENKVVTYVEPEERDCSCTYDRRAVADCASDPPLAATERVLATTRADDVVYGLGAAALARGHRAMAVAVADAAARAAIERAIAAIGADVAIVDVRGGVAGGGGGREGRGAAGVAAGGGRRGGARAPPAAATVSVVGAVAEPAVMRVGGAATMAELVARAGGALDDDWVPIAGGAPAGRLVTREATLAEAGCRRWCWCCRRGMRGAAAAHHGRRLAVARGVGVRGLSRVRRRLSVGAGRARARGDAGERARRRDGGGGVRACTGCGVCDAACPAGLSPRALASDVRDRLARGGVTATAGTVRRVGIDRALLTLRLGLGVYDRPLVNLA